MEDNVTSQNINQIKEMIKEYFLNKLGEDSEVYKLIEERMKNLQIDLKEDDEFSSYYKERMGEKARLPAGCYDPVNKKVVVRSSQYRGKLSFRNISVLVHEIIHALSHGGEDKLGLCQYDQGLGRGFNEMATCYITSQICEGRNAGYSKDHDCVFNMFLRTTKIEDRELYELFFRTQNWLSQDILNRFNIDDPESLKELIRLYDVRNDTEKFDRAKVLKILHRSAMKNQIKDDEIYKSNFNEYRDYWNDIGSELKNMEELAEEISREPIDIGFKKAVEATMNQHQEQLKQGTMKLSQKEVGGE